MNNGNEHEKQESLKSIEYNKEVSKYVGFLADNKGTKYPGETKHHGNTEDTQGYFEIGGVSPANFFLVTNFTNQHIDHNEKYDDIE